MNERFPPITSEEVRTIFDSLVPLEQTRVYQEIFAKGEAVGLIKGRAKARAKVRAKGKGKARAKGKARGMLRGKADSLKLLLNQRFGALPRWALERLDNASMSRLNRWLDGIFEMQSLEGLLGPKPRWKRPPIPPV